MQQDTGYAKPGGVFGAIYFAGPVHVYGLRAIWPSELPGPLGSLSLAPFGVQIRLPGSLLEKYEWVSFGERRRTIPLMARNVGIQ